MRKIKTIGLVAHDARKKDILEWVRLNATQLLKHNLVCTGTTGKLIAQMFKTDFSRSEPKIRLLKSGPLGGDQQMGAMIADGIIDILIFFTDPMTTQPHDVDVKALQRICTVYDIVLANTRSTADFIVTSPSFDTLYDPVLHDYSTYKQRNSLQ